MSFSLSLNLIGNQTERDESEIEVGIELIVTYRLAGWQGKEVGLKFWKTEGI